MSTPSGAGGNDLGGGRGGASQPDAAIGDDAPADDDGPSGATTDDPCPLAADSFCDSPQGSGLCPAGSDVVDCADVRSFRFVQFNDPFGGCGVTTAGEVVCDESAPVPPAGPFVQALGFGKNGGCGLLADHTVRCWPDVHPPLGGVFSQLAGAVFPNDSRLLLCGIRQTDATLACAVDGQPITAPDGQFSFLAVDSVAAACAIDLTGKIVCWVPSVLSGYRIPAPVTGTFTKVALDSSGDACAIRTDGTVTCWGTGARGTPPPTTFVDVDITPGTACGVQSDGTIACWGKTVTDLPAGVFKSLVGVECALSQAGIVRCWDQNCTGGTRCSTVGNNTIERCTGNPGSPINIGQWRGPSCTSAACRAKLICSGACSSGACVGDCVPGSSKACAMDTATICNQQGQWEATGCAGGCIDGYGCRQPTCGALGGACCSGLQAPCEPGSTCQSSCQQTMCDVAGSCTCTIAGPSLCAASSRGSACTHDLATRHSTGAYFDSHPVSCGAGECFSIDAPGAFGPYCTTSCKSDRDCGLLKCMAGCGPSGTCLSQADYDYLWSLCLSSE